MKVDLSFFSNIFEKTSKSKSKQIVSFYLFCSVGVSLLKNLQKCHPKVINCPADFFLFLFFSKLFYLSFSVRVFWQLGFEQLKFFFFLVKLMLPVKMWSLFFTLLLKVFFFAFLEIEKRLFGSFL
jgi:hypothetical protein